MFTLNACLESDDSLVKYDENKAVTEKFIYNLKDSKFHHDLSGSFNYNNNNIVTIENYEIDFPTSKDGPYYLFLKGTKKYPNEIKSVVYAIPLNKHVASKQLYYLTEAPIDGGGSCNNVKHKCESYESLVYGCSQCEFVRNDDGIIIGCKCSQFVGACLHKIEECSNPEKSATDFTHENSEFINLNQYLNQKL